MCVYKNVQSNRKPVLRLSVFMSATHAVVLIGTDVVLNCLKYAFFVTMLHGAIIDI